MRREFRAWMVAAAAVGCACWPAVSTAATVAPGVSEVSVSIPASLPDDEGRPVKLDGGVDIPASGCPCPGIMINHGFLGSWHDSENEAIRLAQDGYVVLRYSSRGFGNTPGEVDMTGPKEVQDMLDAVHWLNNRKNPIVGGKVVHNDIGQFGGSYGGAHAWALALRDDPAVKTVVPTATWTDLYQALMPNDVELLAYLNGFYATGFAPVAAAQNSQLDTTNNYSQEIHRWVAEANSGVNVADLKAGVDSRSVNGRYDDIHIPIFIIQGTNDGLFTQNQAVAAYQALRARHVPVRLYIGGIGHPPSNASLDSPEALHIGAEILAWFDHYLKHVDNGIDRMPPIEYSRTTYFHNRWDGATRSAWSYPFGTPTRLNLCTTGPQGGTLSSTPCPSAAPAVAVNGYAGQGYDQEPVTSSYFEQGASALGIGSPPDVSTAPPTLTYDGPTVATGQSMDLAGIPRMHLQVGAVDQLPAGFQAFAAAFQLDPKLYDVDASGKGSLITRGAFAQPLNALSTGTMPEHQVDFDVFGMSYLLKAGHHLRLTLSTDDAPYLRPTANPFAAVVFAGSSIDLPSGAQMFPTPALGSA